MFGQVPDVHHPASFKMAIADVEIAVGTIDRYCTISELTAVECEIVVIKLQERDASFTILEEAVFKGGSASAWPSPG